MNSSNDFALVIGIKDYPDYRSLRLPVSDAREFADWLMDPQGGNLKAEHCKVVESTLNPLSPGHDQIDRALEELINLTASGGRRFYVFFSGHGLGIDFDDTGLCLAAWKNKRKGLALSSRSYLRYLVNENVFEEVYMFLDCCRVKVSHSSFLNCTLSDPGAATGQANARKFVAFATEYTTAAFEGTENGFFTKALLNGLRGWAAYGDNEVTVAKLHRYLEAQTSILASAVKHNQSARCQSDWGPYNSPVLASFPTPPDTHVETTIEITESGDIELRDDKGQPLDRTQLQVGSTWPQRLKPQAHSLVNHSTGNDLTFIIHPNPTQHVRF